MSADLLLDVSRLVWRCWSGRLPTGIDRTCLAYINHYRGRARAVVQRGGFARILSEDVSVRLFDLLLEGREAFRGRLSRLAVLAALPPWQEQAMAGQFYLNVGHTGLNLPGYEQWLAKRRVRPVHFVHDLIPLTHPEYCRAEEPEKHLLRMQTLLRTGVGVIGNSQDTIDAMTGFAHSQHVRMPPSLVAPLGLTVDHRPAGGSTSPLPGPYFVMVGTIEGRKNHLLMLNLWAEMARRLERAAPTLVIIGQRGWESEQTVDMLERCEALRHHVIELPRCDDEALMRYMRHANALLFPSFVEGYGLPLVEALASGTPVLATDLAVFRELAGDIPEYFSPIDGWGWIQAIEDYARAGSPRRLAQLDRMKGYCPPDWEGHFALVDQWLETLSAASEDLSTKPGVRAQRILPALSS